MKGKVCVITGSASGLGLELAKQLALSGATVVLTDNNAPELNAAVSSLESMGSSLATGRGLDVTDQKDFSSFVSDVLRVHGKIDYFFNNAGIAVSGESRDLEIEHWRRVIDVNLMGVVYGCDLVYKAMVSQGFGHIVNIASLAGLIPFAMNAPYCASKHAVVGLSQTLRIEGEELGVKVSVVCPGFIDTNIYVATEAVGICHDDLVKGVPFKLVSVEMAVHKILAGVKKNKALIIFPFYAKFIWWLQRICGAFGLPLARSMVRNFRKLRTSNKNLKKEPCL
jgi:NAD(P)-dependent dehydrogenase (short-subunit alcohol dehydrogenase family)